ncbi:PREDICTED: eukaryotic translation initiation factor 3 subunit G-like [Fragaria vesca subsp. vesca]|uniref:eukaryotic translation initiation factor 3 subunit G-like n=1 Tax=Fragaria vesca subsp. vesca TaxID=101020 RepID=UPI0002C3191F|nr:PREDICTED: eukaryotic translation initiation factor 3 subunit G-like [Fragaria vesca subsp. vesca]
MRPGSADATQPANPRWGDLDEEDGDKELDLLLLPPKQVIGPNEKGIKKVIEYKFNEEGHKVKITTTTRIQSRQMTKAAVERRSWAKFGDAVDEDAGANLTVVSKDEIMLERPKALGTNTAHELPKTNEGGNTTLKLCRTCGKKGDHWTAQCLYKDLATQSTGDISSSEAGTTSKTGTYVPPGMRPGGKKSTPRNDENSVRVSNLSEDARDADLYELFSPFGDISRAHVVLERETQVSRGFGFVNFVNKEHGRRAIDKLNGYGYDNLILRVEWATPRLRPN